MQGLTDDWRVRLAFPFFLLVDFLLSRQRIARWLFDGFRTKENLRKALMVRPVDPCGYSVCLSARLRASESV